METPIKVGTLTRVANLLETTKLDSTPEMQERHIGDLEQLLMEADYPVKLVNFLLIINDIPSSASYDGSDIQVPNPDLLLDLIARGQDNGFLEDN